MANICSATASWLVPAVSSPAATPEMLFNPELARANPRFNTVARCVMFGLDWCRTR